MNSPQPDAPAVTTQVLDTVPCWACGLLIHKTDPYCRHCGKGQGKHMPWYYRQWGIITLTILGLGPFGLLLIWRSPLLSRTLQWVYTAVILILTGYIGYRLYQAWLLFNAALAATQQTLRF